MSKYLELINIISTKYTYFSSTNVSVINTYSIYKIQFQLKDKELGFYYEWNLLFIMNIDQLLSSIILSSVMLININWRDIKRKNVVHIVDMSSLRAPWQNGPYKNQHTEHHKKTQRTPKRTRHLEKTHIVLCFSDNIKRSYPFNILFQAYNRV